MGQELPLVREELATFTENQRPSDIYDCYVQCHAYFPLLGKRQFMPIFCLRQRCEAVYPGSATRLAFTVGEVFFKPAAWETNNPSSETI